MVKKMSRLIAVVLVMAMVLSFSACKKGSDDSSSGKDGEVTLNLWHIWAADTETGKKPLLDTIAEFEKANPKIKIKVSAYQNETYKTKIKTAMAGDEIPDIFFSWGAPWAESFIKAGKVMPLDDQISDVESKLKEGTKDNFIGKDNKIYALPMTMWAGVLFCNEKIFKDNNVEPPKTYEDLLKVVEVFKKKEIIPIAIGAKESWTCQMMQNILSLRTAGVDLTKKALTGEASFDQKPFVESAAKVKELIDAGAFGDASRALSVSNDQAQINFTMGKAAMRYMGSWETGNVDGKVSKNSVLKDNVVCLNFPSLEGGVDNNGFQGGAMDTFMLSNKTKYKEEAVKALKYITETMSEKSYQYGFGLPTWKTEIDPAKTSDSVIQIDKLIQGAKFCPNWDTFLTGVPKTDYLEYVSKIFSKSLTPEEFAKKMQESMVKNKYYKGN